VVLTGSSLKADTTCTGPGPGDREEVEQGAGESHLATALEEGVLPNNVRKGYYCTFPLTRSKRNKQEVIKES